MVLESNHVVKNARGPSKPSKKSSFACRNCRRRKARCDGAHPKCKTCALYDEECRYELVPSLRYVRELEARVKSLEYLIGDSASPKPLTARQTISTRREGIADDCLELSVTTLGEIGHHNLTSLYTLPAPSLAQDRNAAAQSNLADSLVKQDNNTYANFQRTKSRLIKNAQEQRGLELYTLSTLPKEVQLPLGIHEYLLNGHWKWIQPFFNFIYRPAFMRDMRSQGGEYFSLFLFYSIMAHSARFCSSRETSQTYTYFLEQAKALLPNELEKPGSIPTVQGMLLLSANATSLGLRSQAWTYSGIAFRMLVDMGLHLNHDKFDSKSSYSEEDAEIRRRLFWSCYLWDKLMSLYFGRMPVLQNTTRSPQAIILDDFAENELWHDGSSSQGDFVGDIQPSYPRAATYSVSCFVFACRLSEIINKIILRFYCYPSGDTHPQESEEALVKELTVWKASLPSQLSDYFDLAKEHSPPAHIATLICLYHISIILATRPSVLLDPNNVSSYQLCENAATSIISVLLLWKKSFESCRFLIIAYGIYTAATVFMLKSQHDQHQDPRNSKERSVNSIDMTPDDSDVVYQLNLCHDFLTEISETCPAIKIPARAIKQHLELLTSTTQLPSYDVQNTNASYTEPTTIASFGAPENLSSRLLRVSSRTVPNYSSFSLEEPAYKSLATSENAHSPSVMDDTFSFDMSLGVSDMLFSSFLHQDSLEISDSGVFGDAFGSLDSWNDMPL